ncbi:MAG TPA: hypothetical protein VF212_18050 [Longimicrobiales bacterium]
MGDERLTAELNRLYWESEASVGEIAERLGISRRALYDALAARPAGAACPECGGALVYANRSRRDAGRAACEACGLEPDIATLRAATAEAGAALRRDADRREAARAGAGPATGDRPWAAPEPAVEQEWDAGRLAPLDRDAARRGRALLIVGAALVGAAAGAIAALLLRRR